MCVTAALCITALFHPSLPHFYWRQTCGVVRGTGPSALQAKGRTQSKVRVGRGMLGVGERRDSARLHGAPCGRRRGNGNSIQGKAVQRDLRVHSKTEAWSGRARRLAKV